MDANHYMGDDDRDTLTQPDGPPCPDCGAVFDEPCEKDCGCSYCRARELREQPPTEAA